MPSDTLRSAIEAFTREIGSQFDPSGRVLTLLIEGAGEIELAVTDDGDRIILRGVVLRAVPGDPLLMAALELNARLHLLNEATLGFDAVESRLVLGRMVGARQVAAEGLKPLLLRFSETLADLRDRLTLAVSDVRHADLPERAGDEAAYLMIKP